MNVNWVAVQAVVGAFTLLALLWYAWETRKLRFETQRQARLSSLPVARAELHRAPDRIFIRNSGQAIVGKAALQGFRFRGADGGVWRCTFTSTAMISSGVSVSVFDDIALEEYDSRAILDERALFQTAFSRALAGRSSIRLALYTTDVFGTCYRSELEISSVDFSRWWDEGRPTRDWQPPMLSLQQVREMPEEIPLADFSSPDV